MGFPGRSPPRPDNLIIPKLSCTCKMTPIRYGIVAVIVLTLAVTILAYPALPDKVPSHWNGAGEVDGYCRNSGVS